MKRFVFDPLPRIRASVMRGVTVTAVALATLVPPTPVLSQQTGVIAGSVTGGSGQPVAGALIRVEGTQLGTSTDASGRFRIANVSGDQVTLEVRRIGYRAERVVARVGDLEIRVTLAEQSVILDEVVVTGTAGGQAKRELGNAVTTINAAAAKEIAPINSVQNLLNGRAPGVFVQSTGGQVGTGARIRIRGASSIALSNEPLLYVDGVRVNNAPATGPINQAFGSASISRMNDINPDDIESIEIIKGPAAATLYGTEASNGVIQIITKKGTSGAPRWSLATRVGTNYLQDPEGRFPINWGAVQKEGAAVGVLDTVPIDIIEAENARGTPVFRTGLLQEYDLSASGGSNIFTYFAGAGLEDSEGIEPTSSVKRYSGRLNLSVVPNESFNVGVNMAYVNGNIHLPCEGGCGGRLLGTIWANPENAVKLADGSENPRRGFHTGLPYMYDELVQFWQTVNRFTGGVQVSHRPFTWLSHRLSAGTDRVSESDNSLGLRTEDPLSRTIFGTGADGSRAISTRQVNYYSIDYSASGIANLTDNVKSTTSFGTQYYRNTLAFQNASGNTFPTVGLTALTSTTTNKTSSGDIEEDATLGVYLQEQIGWNDRLFVTVAVRADDNSAFGQNFDRVYYPKYSASWVVSEEPFWTFPIVSALKLRAAYGESGKQPATYSALQTYTSATGPGDVAAVTPQFLGNADLGPERSKEIELGFDMGMLDDRLGVELSWYRKRTVDAILDRQIPPSLGLPNTQPFNAGAIRNSGLEFLVRATPVQRDRIGWDVSLSLATNDSEIESLGTPQAILDLRKLTNTPDFVQLQGSVRHQVGYPIGSFFDQRVVSAAPVPTTGVNKGKIDVGTVMCDNGRGGAMLCAGPDLAYNTLDDAPDVFLGRTLPGTEGAFSNTLTLWEKLRVYALVDFKTDFKKLDGNVRARCTAFTRCEELYFPENFDPKRIAGIQSGGALVDYYINDSDYAKLREVSLSYTLPALSTRWARFDRAVVTLAGRNLHTWTKYPGLEPEAMFLGGLRGGNFGSWEQNAAPQLAQWVLGVNLGW
jgi:TonB-linked SusC/RagA family outer membrane protein